jgi:hypothetical protein
LAAPINIALPQRLGQRYKPALRIIRASKWNWADKEIAMKRASLAVCFLGGVFLLLAGCSSLDLGFDFGGGAASAAGNVRVMDGSPDQVAITLQDTLTKRGLKEVKVSKDASGMLVEGKTAGGLSCGFLLKSVRAADGREQTHVSLEWIGTQDLGMTVQLMADVDRQPGVKK